MSEEKTENNKMEKKESGDYITIKKDSLWKYSTFILAAVLVIGAFVYFTGDKVSPPTGAVINNPQPTLPGQTAKVEVNIDGAPYKGEDDAPVVIVEYTDYQCPFCGRHYDQTYNQIMDQYVKTGKVKYVTKDFPLSFHPFAQKSAEATHCVREQLKDDGYYMMHDKIFANQETLSLENLKKWAREVGADGAKFDSCLDSGKTAMIVQKGMQEGQQDGIQGTPGFFVNGKLISGAVPFANFQQAIEAEL